MVVELRDIKARCIRSSEEGNMKLACSTPSRNQGTERDPSKGNEMTDCRLKSSNHTLAHAIPSTRVPLRTQLHIISQPCTTFSLSIARACGRIVEKHNGHFFFPFVFLRLSPCPNFQTPRASQTWVTDGQTGEREIEIRVERESGRESEKPSIRSVACCFGF